MCELEYIQIFISTYQCNIYNCGTYLYLIYSLIINQITIGCNLVCAFMYNYNFLVIVDRGFSIKHIISV